LRHLDEENKEGMLSDFGHREKGQKAWSLRAIFDMQISTLEKTEFTEGTPGWNKVFAPRTNPGGIGATETGCRGWGDSPGLMGEPCFSAP
jgi:hypothetical protein